jgi:hypothetical protein
MRRTITRERHAPRHAPGQLGRHEVRGAAQADRLQLHHHQVVLKLLGQLGVLAQREGDVLVHRHVGEEGPELEQHAHLAPHLVEPCAVEAAGRMTKHPRFSVRRQVRTHDDPQQRGLPAPRLPHDAHDRAARNREVDVAQHRARGLVPERDVADLYNGGLEHGDCSTGDCSTA